jgi:hypothetical protein
MFTARSYTAQNPFFATLYPVAALRTDIEDPPKTAMTKNERYMNYTRDLRMQHDRHMAKLARGIQIATRYGAYRHYQTIR